MRPATEPREWINGRQAGQIVGCSPMAIVRAALLGQVRTRLSPGVAPRYHKGDVEKLAVARAQPQAAAGAAKLPHAKRRRGAAKAEAPKARASSLKAAGQAADAGA
jgi:hypothetical protein